MFSLRAANQFMAPIALWIYLLAASTAMAAGSSDAESGIRDIIASQIEAFRADDSERAFSFASPKIQSRFGTPERFMSMVRRGYQPVYRPKEFRFLGAEERGRHYEQRVLFLGPDGSLVTGIYSLVKIDGSWRIDGCTLERSAEGV